MSDSGINLVIILFFVLLGLLALLSYLLPSIIAILRKVPSTGSVLVINLFLGWSVVGWIVALALAFRSKQQPYADVVVQPSPPGPRQYTQRPPGDPHM